MDNRTKQYRLTSLIGAVLIGLGAILLLGEIFNVRLGFFLWPFFIIVPGLAFFYFMAQGGKNAAPLAIPGSIITTTGLLLLYQSITNHWESWAYAWALIFPTSVGIGLYISGLRGKNEGMRRTGQGFIRVGLILLILGGLFYEMIFHISGARTHRVVWPAILIVAG
ncbi:MAG: hypothetical protein P8Z41_08720, partial [Anaerolineales bacterium]